MENTVKPAEVSQSPLLLSKLLSVGTYFLVFVLGVISVLTIKHFTQSRPVNNQIPENIPIQITPPNPVEQTDSPPSKALAGVVTASGSARIQRRENIDWLPVASTDNIYHEERIILDNGSLSLKFADITITSDQNESEIYLANLIPESFLFSQTSGVFSYTTGNTITVKAKEALIKVSDGQAQVEVNKQTGEVTIELNQGNSEIAIIDQNNTTRIYKLTENQAAIIDTNNEVQIIK